MIILWVGYNIYSTKKNLVIYGIIFITIFNCLYFWNDLQIDRPPMRKALKIINTENNEIKKIYTTELEKFLITLYLIINFLKNMDIR